MRIVKKLGRSFLIGFIVIQFFGPSKNEDEGEHMIVFFEETNPPPGVKLLLKNSCFDCHSNNTVYPWYGQISPFSNWMADHIREGKEEVNFSEWGNYSVKKKDHKLEEIIEVLENEVMPLKEYTWTHFDARLTENQKEQIIQWAKRTRALYQLNLRPE
ncbi:MAG: heme-binding domain-containing protein [Cellulophaga sp.]